MSRSLYALIITLALAWTTLGPAPAHAATRTADQERVLANLTAVYAGDAQTNADPAASAKVRAIQTAAATQYAALRPLTDAQASEGLFPTLPLGSSEVNLAGTYTNLATIALATRTPGAAWYGRTDVADRVVDALAWLHDTYLADQSRGYYGNWYQWEIGIPTAATRALVLLRDTVDARRPTLHATYVATLDAYLRAGKDGDVDLASRFHTGANLVDITANRILQGALIGDDARIRKAVDDQLTAFATIDRAHLVNGITDGFYADGSFVQHDSVAYTGSYGKVLLQRVLLTIKTLAGTGYLAGRDLTGTVQQWIAQAFAPVIYEGYMMEIVKGRGVARTTSGYTDVVPVIEAVTDLAAHRPDADALALRSWVKHVTSSSKVAVSASSFLSPGSIVAWTRLMKDAGVPASNPFARPQSTFNSMERDVHTGNGYAFALARTSSRISKYEYMSGENLRPWFQGDGAHHLYLAGDDQNAAYGAGFYALVDPHRLPGVTAPVEQRRTVPELYGKLWYEHLPEFSSSSVPQNEYVYFPRSTDDWSGGTSLGGVGVAGLRLSSEVGWRDQQAGLLPDDFVAYQNASGVKSYVMLDGRIVVLGAGIVDPQGREVTSTVDARRSASDAAVTLAGQHRDGSAVRGGVDGEALRWLRWSDAARGTSVGYAFLDDAPVTASVEARSASLRSVRTNNPDTQVNGQIATIGYEHSGTAPESMAYVIVPGGTHTQLAQARDVRVIANTADVQAVEDPHQRVTAVNVFAAGGATAGRFTTDGPATILMKENADRTIELSISDPTQKADRITLDLQVPRLAAASAPGVTVTPGLTSARITVDVGDAHGTSFTVKLGRETGRR